MKLFDLPVSLPRPAKGGRTGAGAGGQNLSERKKAEVLGVAQKPQRPVYALSGGHVVLPSGSLTLAIGPQLTAFCTSALSLASSSAVNSFSA